MKFVFSEVAQKCQYVLNSIAIRTRNHEFVAESVISFANSGLLCVTSVSVRLSNFGLLITVTYNRPIEIFLVLSM